MTTVTDILSPVVAEAIRERRIIGVAQDNPWLITYKTRGGGYLIASTGRQNDDHKPHDLLYVHRGGAVVKLAPTVTDEFAGAVADVTGGRVLS